MTNKQNYQELMRSIQEDYKLDIGSPALEMLAIYDSNTLRRAEEAEAPGVLRIVRVEELQDDALAQFERLLGFESLAFVIGMRDQIKAIAGPNDKS